MIFGEHLPKKLMYSFMHITQNLPARPQHPNHLNNSIITNILTVKHSTPGRVYHIYYHKLASLALSAHISSVF